jgi:hypothetical protein
VTIDQDDLLARLEAAERRIAELEHKNPACPDPETSSDTAGSRKPTRRDLFKLAGAATAGVAAATVMRSSPASAANGASLVLGSTTNTAENITTLSFDGAAGALPNQPLLSVDASAATSTASTGPGRGIDATGGPGGVGMSGFGPGGGLGTAGISDDGVGLIGITTATNFTGGDYGADIFAAANGNIFQAPLPPSGLASDGSPNYTSAGAAGAFAPSFELVRSPDGGLWSSDSSGAFHRMNSVILLPIPQRVIDTRIKRRITGPLFAGNTYTSSAITGSTGIPATALGVMGTLTMVAGKPGGNLGGQGFLAIFPGGTTNPGTSNVNGDTSFAIATGCTVGLGTGAHAGTVSIFVNTPAPVHAVLDVAAYIL